MIGTGRALWSRASSQSMIPPRSVNLSRLSRCERQISQKVPAVCSQRGAGTSDSAETHPVVCGNERWDVSEPCRRVSEAVGNRPLGALVAPVAYSPRHPFPQGHQPQFTPGVVALLVGDRHFSRWRPRWIALRAWGKRDAKSRGENRRKAGVPY